MNIGDKIRHKRLKLNMTLEKLAKKADITLQHLQLIETNKHKNITIKRLEKIAQALGTTVPALFYSEEVPVQTSKEEVVV